MISGSVRNYSNYVKLNLSLFDFSFEFYDRKDVNLEAKPEELFADIVLSPQHTKAFMNLLQQKIKDYEELFGTINLDANPTVLQRMQNEQLKSESKVK